jgi:hypothetical protein
MKKATDGNIVIPYKPRPYQLEMHKDPHRFKIAVFHRQAGKTLFAINELVKKAVFEPGVYLYIGPDKSSAKNIIWKDPQALFKFLPPELIKKTNETELTVYFKETQKDQKGSVFYIEGAADQQQIQRIRGIRPRGVIFDEFAQVNPAVWTEVIFPALNQNGGWAIFISTFKGKNHFYKLFSQYWDWTNSKPIDDPNFRAWYMPASRNPFFTPEQTALAKSTMPPAQYDQEYECLPMSGVSNVFPSLTDLMTGSLKEKDPSHYYSMGVDLAKYKDYTSVSIIDRNTHHLVYQDRWQSDWGTTIEKIILIRKKYNNAHITIDSTGVGDPIAENLARRGVKCDDFKFSNTSKDQLVRKMGIFFDQKKIILPPQDQIPNLINELEQYTYTIMPSGKIQYSAPDGMHDDECISFGLAIWYLKDKPISDLYSQGVPSQAIPNMDAFSNPQGVKVKYG